MRLRVLRSQARKMSRWRQRQRRRWLGSGRYVEHKGVKFPKGHRGVGGKRMNRLSGQEEIGESINGLVHCLHSAVIGFCNLVVDDSGDCICAAARRIS